MRVEGLDFTFLANQMPYTELMGINHKITSSAMEDNTGVRYIREKGWRDADLHTVMKMLDLSSNKLLVLRLLQRGDLLAIIRLLGKELMINGLRLFSKEKLMRLMTVLPKNMLIKMLLVHLPIEYLISKLPPHELFAILRSNKLTERDLLKGFINMPMAHLQFILGKILNENVSHLKHSEMMAMFMQLKKRQILEGMRFLPFDALIPFVTQLVQRQPELLENISKAFMFKIFDQMPKPTLLQAFVALPEDVIMKFFIGQMEDKMLVLVAGQLDDKTLEQYLLSQHAGLIAQLAS